MAHYVGAVLLIVLLAPPAPSPPSVASALIDLTNAERRRPGLSILRSNERLMQAAQIHAKQLLAEGRLAHDLPDARYPRLLDRLDAVSYEWQNAGENIAFGQRDAKQAMASWMKSRGHRANILNGKFTEIGVAQITGRNGRRTGCRSSRAPRPNPSRYPPYRGSRRSR